MDRTDAVQSCPEVVEDVARKDPEERAERTVDREPGDAADDLAPDLQAECLRLAESC